MNEQRAKWTWMVYMAGDNNLSDAADHDLEELRAVGSTADVRVLVQVDNAGDGGTKRWCLGSTRADDTLWEIGETDSGAPEVLLEFLVWAAQNYPAERYAVVLWNHGTGWEPSEIETVARSVGNSGVTMREAAVRSGSPVRRVLFRSSLAKIMALPSPRLRAICSDDGTGHSLDTVELGNVLSQAVRVFGQPIDLLGLDACLMSNLEVAFQVQRFARYMVASQEDEPGDGWPYDVILKTLTDEPEQETADLAGHIVDAFLAAYADHDPPPDVTQTAIDLDRLAPLTASIDRLANRLIEDMPNHHALVWKAQRKSVRFANNTLWDLGDFCRELAAAAQLQAESQQGAAAEPLVEAATEVVDALATGEGRALVHERHRGDGVEGCTGLTLYLLPPIKQLSPHYGALDYSKQHRWHAMLTEYHNV